MLTSLFTRCRSAQKPRVMRTSVSARGRVAHDAPGVCNTGPRTAASGVVESTGGVDMEPPEGYRNRFRDETYDLAHCLVKGCRLGWTTARWEDRHGGAAGQQP